MEANNNSKLREALEAIICGYENADLCDMNYGEWCHDPATVCVNVPLCKAIHEARAALAAPARNCDRYSTADAARAAWIGLNIGVLKRYTDFEEWLFANAEGGAK